MMDVETFLDLTEDNKKEVTIKFATIAPGYTSGRPSVILDGSSLPTVKKYPYLASYTPVSGHRVMIVQGVVMGRIV